MRTALPLAALAAMLCGAGCAQSLFNASVMEQRVVQQFADAVTEENETALRRIASSRFEQKAMSSEDALTDLRVVHLPTGQLSVVEVQESGSDRREVVVKEETGGKYQFHLVKDPVKGYWVVDDVIVRQRSNGTRVAKSTTEVMDLLMTLRRFLDVWQTGTREEILAMTSPDLTDALDKLPDSWLKALTARTASVYEEGMARKPEANLTDGEAVVKLPARNGHLMMKIVSSSNGWLVDDVEVHNHREDNHPGSVRRQADAVNAVNAFLTAYRAEDHQTLQEITGQKLYEGSLQLADLSMVHLPAPADVPAEFDIRAYESQLTFMIPAGREIVRIDLEETSTKPGAAELSDSLPRFTVQDVTLYDRATQKQKSLSAVFTAPARAALFLKALSARDHQMLSHICTTEFARATWKRVTPELLAELPIPELFDQGTRVTDSQTMASMTELEFTNSRGQLFSCRMVNQNGVLKLDDLQYPNEHGQVTSLRTRLELAVPILEFASAWKQNDLTQLQKACSSDFNRLVWGHLQAVPSQFPSLATDLRAPVAETRITQERATVRLRSPGTKASLTASLITEHGFWVVDEIRLESTPGQLVGVREKLRGQIAARLMSGSYSMVHSQEGGDRVVPVERSATESLERPIQQVSDESTAEFNKGAVNQAVYHQYFADDGTGEKPQPAPVSPAVRTKVFRNGRAVEGEGTPGRITTAGARREQQPEEGPAVRPAEAESRNGVQVFGPRADQIASSLDDPQPMLSAGERLTQPIDMTPAPLQNATTNSSETLGTSGRGIQEPGFTYFGPGQQPAPTDPAAGQRNKAQVSEPADAPISIF
ncbi:MAG: hypothetical protein RIK87_25620 [Fuerstiella sp.]